MEIKIYQWSYCSCFVKCATTLVIKVTERIYHTVNRLRSYGHLDIYVNLGQLARSSRSPVINFSFQHILRTNRQHQDLQVCFVDNKIITVEKVKVMLGCSLSEAINNVEYSSAQQLYNVMAIGSKGECCYQRYYYCLDRASQ